MVFRVRLISGWWKVEEERYALAKFRFEADAIEYACSKARSVSGIVHIFNRGQIYQRIQT